jgi:hypothetical protein
VNKEKSEKEEKRENLESTVKQGLINSGEILYINE